MTKPVSPRFLALDVLRGMTICFMIIVNTPGTGATPFAPLLHAQWHGFTPTDLVFPTFMFVVGNAMSFSMPKYRQIGNSSVLGKIFKRTVIIFLLGYLMYWFPFFREAQGGGYEFSPISDTRILGVLQRIALAYCAASLMIHFLSKKTVWILSGIFLLGYWIILYVGGDYSMTGNAGHKLDLILFGESHLYHGEGVAFDPEGFLSTIPSIVNVVAGYYAGMFIQQKGKSFETVAKLMIAGFALLGIAYFWDFVFPINKKLWTSSFVLYTIALDLAILGILTFIVEIKGITKGTYFFQVFGKNPLFIYLLSEILYIVFFMIKTGSRKPLFESLNDNFFQKILPGPWGSLAFALCFMLLCWLVGYWMDRKKIYVRV
ncbi:MAG TPA: acyltransferase family protein [Agriterribacter sp.]|nr:acyltransferase family protein [Agriterribacter sp.]